MRPLAADLIRNAEPILSQFCVHEKEQDCDRCFLRGKTSVHYMKDESGRFILMNGAVDRFIQPRISRDGCKQSIIGLTLHDLMDEDQAQPLVVQDLKVLQSGKPQEMVQWLPDPSQPGTVRQWFVSKRLMIMSDRRRFIVAVAYDITQFSRRKSDKESLTQIAHCNREHQA